MVLVVFLGGVLVLVDVVYLEGSVHFNRPDLLILIRNQLDTEQIILDINGNKINDINLIMYLLNTSPQSLRTFGNLLDPKLQLLLNLE